MGFPEPRTHGGRRANAGRKRRGAVFPRRFHDVVLKSLRPVRNALRYVLNNDLRHTGRLLADRGRPDELPGARGVPVAPGGWKLRVGWKRYYARLRLRDVPAAA